MCQKEKRWMSEKLKRDYEQESKKTYRNYIHIKKREGKKIKDKPFNSPGDMITSYHLGHKNGKLFQLSVGQNDGTREGDEENDCNVTRKILQGRFNFNNEKGKFSLPSDNLQRKNRLSPERRGIDESFRDFEQNIKSKLKYVSLCKSTKYLIRKGSNDLYGVKSPSIAFINGPDSH